MSHEYSPEELEAMEGVSRRFNNWINEEIRQGNIRVDIMVELMGNLYIRLRTHVEFPEMMKYMEHTVNLLEGKIEKGLLKTHLPDGTPVPYFSKEQQVDKPGFLEMIRAADDGVSDEELEQLLSE